MHFGVIGDGLPADSSLGTGFGREQIDEGLYFRVYEHKNWVTRGPAPPRPPPLPDLHGPAAGLPHHHPTARVRKLACGPEPEGGGVVDGGALAGQGAREARRRRERSPHRCTIPAEGAPPASSAKTWLAGGPSAVLRAP